MSKEIKKYKNRETGEIVEVTFLKGLKGDIFHYYFSCRSYSQSGGVEGLKNFNKEWSELNISQPNNKESDD